MVTRTVAQLRTSSYVDNYIIVLLLLVATYVISVSITQTTATPIVLTVQVAAVWFALRTSVAHMALRRVANVGLVAAAAFAVGSYFFHHEGDELGAIFLVSCVLYFIAPFSIVRHLVLRPAIDRLTLVGAVDAYLLIGMFFAFAYRALGELGSVPFYGSAGHGTLSQDLFFSFVTMTTLGYGNLVPAANPGQTLAVVEALTGQLFLIVAVGKIISSWTPRQSRNRPGSLPATSLGPRFQVI